MREVSTVIAVIFGFSFLFGTIFLSIWSGYRTTDDSPDWQWLALALAAIVSGILAAIILSAVGEPPEEC